MIARRLFFALPLVLALPAGAQDFGNITGSYKALGRNADGSAYTGRAAVTEVDNVVGISWQVGNSVYAGKGLREDRIVTVYWGAETPIVYVIMKNGELHGTWAGGRALERLVRD